MDIRNQLVEDKHYALVPVPVIEMLARAGLSGTQMSIYMLHWSAGHIAGDWKSTIAVSVLIDRLKVSRATVQRAYRGLVKKGMIRRAIGELGSFDIPEVEVLIPEDLQGKLLSAPSRRKAQSTSTERVGAPNAPAPHVVASEVELDNPEPHTRRYKAARERMQSGSKAAKATGRQTLRAACEVRMEKLKSTWVGDSPRFRNIHPKYAYKIRKAIEDISSPDMVANLWHQVMWSIERGDFSYRNVPHAFNTAMWLLRRGIWERPSEMPKDWRWTHASIRQETAQM